jgi:flagellar basal-body rod protein FlgG
MFNILRIASSGIIAQQLALDVVGNNIANLQTPGFKRSRADTYDARYAPWNYAGTEPYPAEAQPHGTAGNGTLSTVMRLTSQGPVLQTGRSLDVAIQGDGFFEVTLADGRRAYTRDGTFGLDANGRLVTASGLPVGDIVVPPDATGVRIGADGTVRGRRGDVAETVFGQLPLVRFVNPRGLLAIGENLFVPTDNSGAAQPLDLVTTGRERLLPGSLEGSNVELSEEFTRMIQAQRAYQANLKVVQTWDELISTVNSLRR